MGATKNPACCRWRRLYIRGLLEGFTGAVKTSPEALAKVAEIASEEGQEGLYLRAKKIDPAWTKKIHPNDRFRTERVLGVFFTSGEKMSEIFAKQPDEKLFDALTLVLSHDRVILRRRIDERVDRHVTARVARGSGETF